MKRWMWLVQLGLLLAGAPLSAVLFHQLRTPPFPIPLPDEVRHRSYGSEVLLVDRFGRPLHQIRVDDRLRRLEWVSLEEISQALPAVLVAAEDRRFFSHRGVDWIAVTRAVFSLLRSSGSGGASTLTMQLAGFLEEGLQPERTRRSPSQKWRQIRAALALERAWSKGEILEAYLNLVSFRGELQGIVAASRGLLRKDPHGISLGEAAFLVALLPAPNAASDRVMARACRLLREAGDSSDCSPLRELVPSALSRPYSIEGRQGLAYHAAHRIVRASEAEAGERPTTLDAELQRYAVETLREHLLAVRSQNVRDGAVLVLENLSGNVLAYVGSSGDLSTSPFVDGVLAARQAGSTLKPILYGQALEERLLTVVSPLADDPLDLPVLGGLYRPRNYDNRFQGTLTFREALASSVNVPAVRVLQLVGVESFTSRLERFGFESLRSAEYYGPSLALGSADVTLWDLVNAYRALANGGLWTSARLQPEEGSDSRRVLSEQAAFIVSDVLSDRESRRRTFGLESPLSTRFWTAVKTGTSKDMRDNWCVGYSSEYTVGVWVGNFSGEPMWNVSGVTGAAPVWVELMDRLHKTRPGLTPAPPGGLLQREVWVEPLKRSVRDWFLEDAVPTVVERAAAPARRRIVYPPEGTFIALDPDIPPDRQRVLLEARTGGDEVRWVLNGEPLGVSGERLMWEPAAGEHELTLEGRDGLALDVVRFTVRGAASSDDTQEPPPQLIQ